VAALTAERLAELTRRFDPGLGSAAQQT